MASLLIILISFAEQCFQFWWFLLQGFLCTDNIFVWSETFASMCFFMIFECLIFQILNAKHFIATYIYVFDSFSANVYLRYELIL